LGSLRAYIVLFEALRRSGIRVVPTTHEQSVPSWLNRYGRATGRPGVFVTVPGPGLTNSLTPIAEAFVDSTPMLGIVTEVPDSAHTFQMHEIRQADVARPVVKSVRTVEHTSDIASAVEQMLKLTTQEEPGPCILQIPSNLFWDKVDQNASKIDEESSNIPDQEMEAVLSRLQSAKRVGLSRAAYLCSSRSPLAG
jgi:acetolactate synthase-1/2/3 large subunit